MCAAAAAAADIMFRMKSRGVRAQETKGDVVKRRRMSAEERKEENPKFVTRSKKRDECKEGGVTELTRTTSCLSSLEQPAATSQREGIQEAGWHLRQKPSGLAEIIQEDTEGLEDVRKDC
eukprot:761111-Hanusia_phi.AAC.1